MLYGTTVTQQTIAQRRLNTTDLPPERCYCTASPMQLQRLHFPPASSMQLGLYAAGACPQWLHHATLVLQGHADHSSALIQGFCPAVVVGCHKQYLGGQKFELQAIWCRRQRRELSPNAHCCTGSLQDVQRSMKQVKQSAAATKTAILTLKD